MLIFRNIKRIQEFIIGLKNKGKTIGFVPTMGYLHEGHLSLMRQSKRENDISVISIFVNPIQFGPKEDFGKYPRDFKRDEKLAKLTGVDIIFYPSIEQMYPTGYLSYVEVEKLSNFLCGVSRPGHFRGVTTVVTKLFNIVQPDIAYFGQKDAQQVRIIQKMTQDLNMPIKVKVMSIVRESDGLAMSSRNMYLSSQERKDALILNRALKEARRLIKTGVRDSRTIISTLNYLISTNKTAKIEYIKIVDPQTLTEVKKIEKSVLIVLAVWIGKTRLIDNLAVNL